MKLLGRHTAVFGLKGQGKSNWIQWVVSDHEAYRNTLAYDVCREHAVLDRYLPEYRSGDKARAELGQVVSQFITNNHRSLRPDLFVIEEASRVAPNGGGAADELMDLVDLARHYGTGIMLCARRPAKVDTNLVEMADNIIVFNLRGKNDVKRLNNEAPGAGDAAKKLSDYEYLRIDSGREWTRHSAVPEMDTTGRL